MIPRGNQNIWLWGQVFGTDLGVNGLLVVHWSKNARYQNKKMDNLNLLFKKFKVIDSKFSDYFHLIFISF